MHFVLSKASFDLQLGACDAHIMILRGFTLQRLQGDGQMLTASGDTTIRQWDNLSSAQISSMSGHAATVKCLAAHPRCDDIFASGVRSSAPTLHLLAIKYIQHKA